MLLLVPNSSVRLHTIVSCKIANIKIIKWNIGPFKNWPKQNWHEISISDKRYRGQATYSMMNHNVFRTHYRPSRCFLGRAGADPGAAGEPLGSIPQRSCFGGIGFHGRIMPLPPALNLKKTVVNYCKMANISQQTSGLCNCKLKKSAKRILWSPNPTHSITNHNILKSKASDY
jgi:hypothetical protein